MAKKETMIDAFVRAPRSIMFAQDLTSTEKVVLCIMIDKFLTMKAFDKLQPDGSFYITGKELESKMDIKKDQILKKYIPNLESKGFINKISRPEDKEGAYKTYCYFTLNWKAILNHKGDKKDAAVQAKRAAKAEKIKTRQLEQIEAVEEPFQMQEEIAAVNKGGYEDYLLYSEMMEREERQKQAESQRAEDSVNKQDEEPQSFDISSIMIQDDFEDDAAKYVRANRWLLDAGEQYGDYM